jgi:hypothetical protein
MDLLQNTAVFVPVPIPKCQILGSITLPDPGAIGAAYHVKDQEGNLLAGAGTVTVNVPYPGQTTILMTAHDFQERGTTMVYLVDAGNNLIAMGQIDAGVSTSTVDAIGASLVDTLTNTFVIPTNHLGNVVQCSVTALSTANLGPYALYVNDHAGNQIGAVYGRIVTALGGGLDAAQTRAAIGLANPDLDTQIGGILTAIATRAAPGNAMTLTSGERDAVANALLDLASAVETGCTPRQALRLLCSVLGGVIVNTAPGVWQFRGAGVGTTRVTASIPGDGSRPSMILTL